MKRSKVGPRPAGLRTALFIVAAGVFFVWAALPGFATQNSATCSTNQASRELDYWLGDWTVTYPGAPAISTSTVQLDLDKCLLVESWSGGKRHSGKNMFAYSSDDMSWHGMFADNEGRVHVFEGKVTSGSAEFRGPSRGPNGEAVLNRIRVIRMTPDRVEQIWEKSTDNGTTWTTVFQGEYSRKKS